MRRRVTAGLLVLGLCGVAVAAGCGSEASPAQVDEVEREASAWVQVIRTVGLAGTGPVDDGADLPVVFAGQDSESTVPAEVQVEVVKTLKDEADVRFVDDRDGAIAADEPDQPVKDEGVLLTLANPVPPTGSPVELEVGRYRHASDATDFRVVLRGGSPGWQVVSVVPPPA
jgi:hypothetical protein